MDRILPRTVPCNAATHPTQKINCFRNPKTELSEPNRESSLNQPDGRIFRDTKRE